MVVTKTVLGDRHQQKRAKSVTKNDSWSPPSAKKSKVSRQERFLEPVTSKKEPKRSPRPILGARNQQKRAKSVAKTDSWSLQPAKKSKVGRQDRFLGPVTIPKKPSWSPRTILGARTHPKKAKSVAKTDSWSPHPSQKSQDARQAPIR
jgi:hypothetical protein